MTDRTRHEIDFIDSANKDKSYQEKKDKESLIDEIISICEANKDNTYCSKYQLTDMIKQTFKLYDIYDWSINNRWSIIFKLLFITMIIFNKPIHRKKVRLFLILFTILLTSLATLIILV